MKNLRLKSERDTYVHFVLIDLAFESAGTASRGAVFTFD